MYNQFSCGGSVLTATRGLTPAHCLEPNVRPTMLAIQAGSKYHRDHDDADEQYRELLRYLRHPEFDLAKINHDIAILYWTGPLIFGATVQPVILARPDHEIPYGQLVHSSGWSYTRENDRESIPDILQATLTNKVCKRLYSKIRPVTGDMICAAFVEGGRGPCNGDFGGPLVQREENTFIQLGVVSWSRGCAKQGLPTVYARVPFFYNWINENL